MLNPDPAAWTYVDSYYVGTSEDAAEAMAENTGEAHAAMIAGTRHPSAHSLKLTGLDLDPLTGKCDHCGACHAWGSVFTSAEGMVAVGHQCAAHIFNLPDRATLAVARAQKTAAAKRLARREFIAGLRILGALMRACPAVKGWMRSRNDFAASLRVQALTKGHLSERQLESATKSAERWAGWEAKRAEEKAAAPAPVLPVGPAPTGRVTFAAEVLRTWTKSSEQWGESTKCKLLVLDGPSAGASVICGAPTVHPADGHKRTAAKGDKLRLAVSCDPAHEAGLAWGKRAHVKALLNDTTTAPAMEPAQQTIAETAPEHADCPF